MDQDDGIFKDRIKAVSRAWRATVHIKDDNLPCQIEEGLYLGSLGAALNKSALKSMNITHILTVARSPLPPHPNDFIYRIVKVSDQCDTNLAPHFDACFEFIDEARSKGGVLVHCIAGRSRSVTIVLSYLMKKHDMSLSDALKLVKSKRSMASPNTGFIKQLQNLEQSIIVAKVAMAQEV